jgi:uncharacterized membrane protein
MSRHRWILAAGLLVVLGTVPLADGAVFTGARGIGYAVCSQLSAHSFFVAGHQLPLCARCTGIYLGFLVGVGGMALLGKLGGCRWPPRTVTAVLLLSIAAMAGDGVNSLTSSLPEAVRAYEPTNMLRLITGIAAGTSLALLEVPLLNDVLWANRDMTESVSDFGELFGFAILAALVGTLVYSEHPIILYPAAILETIGVLGAIGAAGTALAATVLRRERKALCLTDAAPVVVAGLGLALAAMAALGAIRYYFSLPIGI